MDSVKLVDICRIEKGQQIDTSRLNDSHCYRYINGGVKESGYYDSFNSNEECVLVSEGGASCGYVNYINEPFWCGCHCYRLFDLKVMPKYLFYALKANQERIMDLRTGVCMPNIKKKDFQDFVVSIDRDAKRQVVVVEVLDTIQKAIDLKRKQLEDLDELVKSKFQEMFGDIRTNDKNWDFVLLNEICDVRDGTHDSPKYHESGYPLLTSKNFTSGEIDMQEVKYISKEDYDAINIRSKVDCGDVVLPMIGTIGHPVVIDVEPEFAIKNVALIKFGASKYSNYFIKQILDSEYFKHYVVMHNKGNTQKFVSLGDIRALPIPMVPFHLQQENEAFVKKVNAASAIIKQEIRDLEELMDSKMDEYFG